jgi:predicted PurR-regulated permease PerM
LPFPAGFPAEGDHPAPFDRTRAAKGLPDGMEPQTETTLAKKTLIVSSVALSLVVAVAICWVASSAVLLIFAGLLLAAVIDALSRPLRMAGLGTGISRFAVVVVLFLLIIGAAIYGGVTLVQQFSDLWAMARNELQNIATMINEMGINIGEGSTNVRDLLPKANNVVGSAPQAVMNALGIVGNVFIAVFLALFIIAQPSLYRKGIVSLFPKSKRQRIDETLHASADELVLWLAGTGISMLTVFVVTWIGLFLVGMPSAFVLALQAGLLAFIPTLGPFVAGIPIVLVGLSAGPSMALWGLGVYVAVQGVESYASQPVAQRYTSALPPALTLGAQLLFGVLFGTLGVILAVPLTAVLMVIVQRLYTQDTLGGGYEGVGAPKEA